MLSASLNKTFLSLSLKHRYHRVQNYDIPDGVVGFHFDLLDNMEARLKAGWFLGYKINLILSISFRLIC